GRYRLLPARPLPGFSSQTATAYAAQDETHPQAALFSLVFESVVPRVATLRTLAGTPPAGLLRIAGFGIIDWQLLRRRALAVAFEAPGGERLSIDTPRMSPSELVQRVLWPAARTLRELAELGIAHRSIRLENLYWSDARRSSVVLGE